MGGRELCRGREGEGDEKRGPRRASGGRRRDLIFYNLVLFKRKFTYDSQET